MSAASSSAAPASFCVDCGCWPTHNGCSNQLVRVLPHIVDTVLLGSAIAMAVISAQYPFAADWLTAKLIGLLIYIGCGTMALKRARSKAAGVFPRRRAAELCLHRIGCAEPQRAGPLAWIAEASNTSRFLRSVAQPRWWVISLLQPEVLRMRTFL
jgi:hypothetical protein